MEGQTTTGLSIWSSLGADSFRVLRINQVEPEISTELIERQHSDISPYYALSYAWGDQKSTWNISCQQTDVAVTPHLHEALRCIVKLYGKLDLFVDAHLHRSTQSRRKSATSRQHVQGLFAGSASVGMAGPGRR